MGKALLIAASAIGGMFIENQLHLAGKATNAIKALFSKDSAPPEQSAETKKK
jgi:hypothetical protein